MTGRPRTVAVDLVVSTAPATSQSWDPSTTASRPRTTRSFSTAWATARRRCWQASCSASSPPDAHTSTPEPGTGPRAGPLPTRASPGSTGSTCPRGCSPRRKKHVYDDLRQASARRRFSETRPTRTTPWSPEESSRRGTTRIRARRARRNHPWWRARHLHAPLGSAAARLRRSDRRARGSGADGSSSSAGMSFRRSRPGSPTSSSVCGRSAS